jgi:hypothetical protein
MSNAYDTVTDYIEDARTLLLDTVAPYRYDDPSLLVAFNATLLEGRRLRPDIFVYATKSGSVPSFDTNADQQINIEEQFRLAFVYGLIGHALARDQEDVQDGRASAFLKLFSDTLIGVRTGGVAAPQAAS